MAVAAKLAEGLKSLWKEGLFTDFTIEVENKQFQCHKLVLVCASEFFQEVCEKPEVTSAKIEGYCPATVEKVLEYIYEGGVHLDSEESKACAEYLKVYKDSNFPEKLARVLLSDWENEQCLDYSIKVEDECFRVHRLVIVTLSWYFRAMLTSEMVESQADSVTLKGLDANVLKKVLEFMYKGEFSDETQGIEEIFACAEYLQAHAVMKGIEDMLMEKLNPDNCIETLDILIRLNVKGDSKRTRQFIEDTLVKQLDDKNCFTSFDICSKLRLEDGVHHCELYIKFNFDAIVKAHPPKECSYYVMLSLAKHWSRAEWDLLQAIGLWLQVDYAANKQYLPQLAELIRFALLKPKELTALKQHTKEVYTDLMDNVKDKIAKAEEYHKLTINEKVIYDSEQNQVRGSPYPYLMTLECDMHFVVDEGKSWRQYKTKNRPADRWKSEFGDDFIIVNGFLIFTYVHSFEGPYTGIKYVFDPRLRTWSKLPMMKVPREYARTVYHGEQLYMLGGQNQDQDPLDLIEKFSFRTNDWQVLKKKLPIPLGKFAIEIIGDKIFFGGGETTDPHTLGIGDGGIPCHRMFCYDLTTQKFCSKADLPFKCEYFIYIRLAGEHALVGGGANNELDYYSVANDQWTTLKLSSESPFRFGIQNAVRCKMPGDVIFLNGRIPKPDPDNMVHGFHFVFGLWLLSVDGKRATEFVFDPHYRFNNKIRAYYQPLLLPATQSLANADAKAKATYKPRDIFDYYEFYNFMDY